MANRLLVVDHGFLKKKNQMFCELRGMLKPGDKKYLGNKYLEEIGSIWEKESNKNGKHNMEEKIK